MALDIALLAVGMLLLIKGADFFVGGSSDIARALRVPPLIIGLTLVSIGTSAPEASVSIIGALGGMADMSLGNVIGSNIFNTLLILGVGSVIVPLAVGKEVRKYDIPVLVGLCAVLILFSFVITPMKLDIFEAIALLCLFVGYIVFLILRTKKRSKIDPSAPENQCEGIAAATYSIKHPLWLSILLAAVGLACIIFGGDAVVDGASGIAKALGMSEALVGLTIVAVGTSLPELVTSVVASLKKENDLSLGNVIGSNIFNIVFILGLSGTIGTLTFDISILTDMLVMLGSAVLVLIVTRVSKEIPRWQGIVMVLMYAAYLAYIIIRN